MLRNLDKIDREQQLKVVDLKEINEFLKYIIQRQSTTWKLKSAKSTSKQSVIMQKRQGTEILKQVEFGTARSALSVST